METLRISYPEQLVWILTSHNVPVDRYGKGEAKTIDHLFNEVSSGECILGIEDNKIVRLVDVLCLDVCWGEKVLVEDLQILTDGRRRKRTLESSLGEKMRPHESVEQALERVIREEIPFLRGCGAVSVGIRVKHESSQSYPGIMTRYCLHLFELPVTAENWPALVIMEPDGKIAFYKWQEK